MINKYTIDLRQFNNGEDDKLSFPIFEQCVLYSVHKLKKAWENGTCITQAIMIVDSLGRRIIINPSVEELGEMPSFDGAIDSGIRLELKKDPLDGDGRFLF